jgi:hypothetical protein
MQLSVGFAQQHEAAAADISCCGMDNSKREARRYRSVHGVAALAQNVYANL